MSTTRMGEMTVAEVREYLKHNQTVILPYGVVEQHGYHLPLDTDIRNADLLAAELAAALGCIAAPTLTYCFSGGMLPGTINVKPNTFSNMMGEIIESLSVQGFRNIIIVPGHGGSESLVHLKESLRILRWLNPALKDLLILFALVWEYSPTWMHLVKNRDYHAAEAETSLMMHLSPGVVRSRVVLDAPEVAEMLRADPDSYQRRTAFTKLSHEVVQTEQRRDVSVGVMGYPDRASPATGRKIVEEIVANMTPVLRQAIAEATEGRTSDRRHELVNPLAIKILAGEHA